MVVWLALGLLDLTADVLRALKQAMSDGDELEVVIGGGSCH